jgi:septal ring factor EnvC (AmiA/AmiB activator)
VIPDYDAKKYPITEALLVVYDLATQWSQENGETHRDNFRFASMLAEVTAENHKLEAEIAQKEKEIAEINRALIIVKSLKQGRFQG